MRRIPLQTGVRTAVAAHAVDDVPAAGIFGQHVGDDGRIVLQIRIQADDAVHPPVAGRDHARPDGILMAGIGCKADGAAAGVNGMALFQQPPGGVGAAVVHIEDEAVFPHEPSGLAVIQDFGQRRHGAGQDLLFIITGDDQRQKGGGT